MRSPLVSVLLATYRPRPEWLRAAVESVLRQTHGEFELLVLDDEQARSTRDLVKSYGDARIRYLPGPQRGPAANHCFGIDSSSALLVSVINHDDTWEPMLLERLLSAYSAAPGVVLAFSDHWVMDERGVVDETRTDLVSRQWGRANLKAGLHQPFDHLGLCLGAVALAQAAVFARAPLEGKLPRYPGRAYDRYLVYLLARTGLGAVYVPERLARWRTSSSSLTSQRSFPASLSHLRLHWALYRDPALSVSRPCLRRKLAASGRSVFSTALRPSAWHAR